MRYSFAEPLLVVTDVVVGERGVVLLPAVPLEGLPLTVGDPVDLVHDDERDEVVVLGLEPDRDPTRVRLRVRAHGPIGPGFEVWPSQTQSHVTLRRPMAPAAPAPAAARRR